MASVFQRIVLLLGKTPIVLAVSLIRLIQWAMKSIVCFVKKGLSLMVSMFVVLLPARSISLTPVSIPLYVQIVLHQDNCSTTWISVWLTLHLAPTSTQLVYAQTVQMTTPF
jgi:hypothetical protein